MGSFQGHALPGSFFFAFGLHWTVQIWIRYFKSKYERLEYANSASYSFTCLCRRLKTYQMEGILKVVVCLIGIFGEVMNSTIAGREFHVFVGNKQHCTMYAGFAVSGIVDISLHHKARFLPKNADFIALTIAFIIEGLMFKFHLYGRNRLDTHIHTLLLLVIGANVIAILAAMQIRRSPAAGLTAAYFILLQGTWFWQVAFILYNPFRGPEPWDSENSDQLLLLSIIFCWHAMIVFLMMFVIGAVVWVVFTRRCSPSHGHRDVDEIDLENLDGRSKKALLTADGDSDLEM